MGFDDFFEDKHNYHGNYREPRYIYDDDHGDNRYSHEEHYPAHGSEGHL